MLRSIKKMIVVKGAFYRLSTNETDDGLWTIQMQVARNFDCAV